MKIILKVQRFNPETDAQPRFQEYSVEVNPNTVMRAYAYLQDKEIIYNKRGIGYFVANDAFQKTVELMKSNFIKNDLPEVFKTMRLLNMDFDELQALNKKHVEQKP